MMFTTKYPPQSDPGDWTRYNAALKVESMWAMYFTWTRYNTVLPQPTQPAITIFLLFFFLFSSHSGFFFLLLCWRYQKILSPYNRLRPLTNSAPETHSKQYRDLQRDKNSYSNKFRFLSLLSFFFVSLRNPLSLPWHVMISRSIISDDINFFTNFMVKMSKLVSEDYLLLHH